MEKMLTCTRCHGKFTGDDLHGVEIIPYKRPGLKDWNGITGCFLCSDCLDKLMKFITGRI